MYSSTRFLHSENDLLSWPILRVIVAGVAVFHGAHSVYEWPVMGTLPVDVVRPVLLDRTRDKIAVLTV